MKKLNVVIDTNVFISALRSNKGASYKLLSNIESEKFNVNISVPLIIEYESVAKRANINVSHKSIDDILDFICAHSIEREIHYLWRPFLKDPKDDMVLELAVESESDYIITFNIKDYRGVEQFGVKIIKPKDLIEKIGLLK